MQINKIFSYIKREKNFYIKYPYLFLLKRQNYLSTNWEVLVINLDTNQNKTISFDYPKKCIGTPITSLAYDNGYIYWSQYKDGMPFGPIKKCTGSYKKVIDINF